MSQRSIGPRRALAAALLLAACNGSPTAPPNQVQVAVTPDSISLFIGNTDQLTAQVSGGGASTFTWASADPSVAKVDQQGVVTAVAKGKTTITATTTSGGTSRQGTAVVLVLDPSGSACPGVDTVQTWTGTLDILYGDTVVQGQSITGVRHELTGTLTLTLDPSTPQGATQLTYQGVIGGSASLNESVGQITNVGSGTPDPGSTVTLYIDADACTWYFTGGYAVNATESGPNFSQDFTPEPIANFGSKELPLGIWPHGLSYTAGFPAYLGTGPFPTTPADGYYVVSALGITIFTGNTARGPASVAFSVSPN
ncbi:MAG TPA: Ig-like domain-containing protein [Gemmatimonadales bacterium]|nr:Ig-like domain-containing protein [Gemmatimonadales bacterium]